jgi:hypothetical protein
MMAMIRLVSTLVIAAALGGAVVPAALAGPEAVADGWQVLESHGGARFQPAGDQSWWPVRTGSRIPSGSMVATGSSGFLIIARAGESITVRPNSRVALPDEATDQVRQTTGDLRYRITRVPDRRFAVETPYLSLLVKGTVFEVSVGDRGAAVEVTEGRVRVDAVRGQAVELSPGQSARIAPGAQAELEFRAAPESPFVAAPASREAIAAAYTHHDRGRATGDRPSGAGQETHRSARADSGRGDSGPAGSDAAPRGDHSASRIGESAGMSRPTGGDAAVDSVDGAPDGVGDPAGAGRNSGVEIGFFEGRIWIDAARAQIDEVTPRRDAIVRSAQAGLDLGIGSEGSEAVPLPQPETVAVAQSDDAGDTSVRPPTTAEVSDRAVQASGGWRRSDAVAWAILLAVAATLWWRLRRSPDRPSSGHGASWRWPWQRSSLAPSGSSAGSSNPGSASRRAVRNRA